MENRGIRVPRVSHMSMDATLAAVAGQPEGVCYLGWEKGNERG